MIAVDSFSKFKLSSTILTQIGDETFGLMTKFDFLNKDKLTEEQIIKITVDSTRAGRPDLISNDLYSTSIHMWLLIQFNNITNPFNWPNNGSIIKAPSPDLVAVAL